MPRFLGFALFALFLALPQDAFAQRRGRGGPAHTIGGEVFNPTQTPEWRQAGGNPEVYEQIMLQKQQQANYQAMVKQQQAYDKWIKDQAARKAKGQPVDPAYTEMVNQQDQSQKALKVQEAKVKTSKKTKKRTPAKTKAASEPSKS